MTPAKNKSISCAHSTHNCVPTVPKKAAGVKHNAVFSRPTRNCLEDNEHIGVVTGLSDLVSFLAACRIRSEASAARLNKITAVLFGQKASLPERLQFEFDHALKNAFPFLTSAKVSPDCLKGSSFDQRGVPPALRTKSSSHRIVYGNLIHKRLYQEFFSSLMPDEFIFFDNGLSSYADHKSDIKKEFAALDLPFPSVACYSLCPPLPVPEYLGTIPQRSLTREEYTEFFDQLRLLASDWAPDRWLPPHVIIGTSLFRTNRISWEEERSIYLRLIDKLQDEEDSIILFKAHPRASSRPLITEDDGVDVLDSSLPVEAFVNPRTTGVVYSISSTSLLTMEKFFGWTAYRLETEMTQKLLADSPHLSKVNSIEPLIFPFNL